MDLESSTTRWEKFMRDFSSTLFFFISSLDNGGKSLALVVILRMACLCSIFYDEKYHWRSSNFFFNSVFRLSSPVGILRAVWIGGKGHPRDFGASLHDSLPNDYSRDTAAHGENTVDKWVPLKNDNYLGVNGNEAVEHRSFNPADDPFDHFRANCIFLSLKYSIKYLQLKQNM